MYFRCLLYCPKFQLRVLFQLNIRMVSMLSLVSGVAHSTTWTDSWTRLTPKKKSRITSPKLLHQLSTMKGIHVPESTVRIHTDSKDIQSDFD